jgi:hypothetical protein
MTFSSKVLVIYNAHQPHYRQMIKLKSEMLWEWEKYGILVEGKWDDDMNKMGHIEGMWNGLRILSSERAWF